jgi:hypothetical protein
MPPSSEAKKAYNKAYRELNKTKYNCEHNKLKYRCKECGGSQICIHDKNRAVCKECKGIGLCQHNRQKSRCKECGGSQICEHNNVKCVCKECGGSQICEHKRLKHQCKECGGGSALCQHNKRKSICKECGGSQICEHHRHKSICKECVGSQICEHSKRISQCKDCNLMGCLVSLQRGSIRRMLLSENITKLKPTIEYLGCSAEYFLEYLQKKMVDGMTFKNIHIDHIKPISRFNLQNEEAFLDCCHYTNLQPLLAQDNLIKNNKWNKINEEFWVANIKGKEYLPIYNPLD